MEETKIEGLLYSGNGEKRQFHIELNEEEKEIPEDIEELRALKHAFTFKEPNAGKFYFLDENEQYDCFYFTWPYLDEESFKYMQRPDMQLNKGETEIFVLHGDKKINFRLYYFENYKDNAVYSGLYDVFEKDGKREFVNTDFDLNNFYIYTTILQHTPDENYSGEGYLKETYFDYNIFRIREVLFFDKQMHYVFGKDEKTIANTQPQEKRRKFAIQITDPIEQIANYEYYQYKGRNFKQPKAVIFGLGASVEKAKAKAEERIKIGKMISPRVDWRTCKYDENIIEAILTPGPDFQMGIIGRGKNLVEANENALKLNENMLNKNYKPHIMGIFEYKYKSIEEVISETSFI